MDTLAYETCSRLLNEKRYHSLHDFDNHLDNIAQDWRNLDLNKSILNDLSSSGAEVDSLSRGKRDDWLSQKKKEARFAVRNERARFSIFVF